MISAPTIDITTPFVFGTSVSVVHTAPTTFTAPSTAWSYTRLLITNQNGEQVSVADITTGGTVTVAITLPINNTYRIVAVAVSDAGEVSEMSASFRVTTSDTDLTGKLAHVFTTPSIDPDAALTLADALSKWFEAVGWELADGSRLMRGVNLFAHKMPKWFYDRDVDWGYNPENTLVLVQSDAFEHLALADRKRSKIRPTIRLSVWDGRHDRALLEAVKMYRTFLDREEVAFTADALSVRSVVPLEEPSVAGTTDDNVVQYAFRLSATTTIC